MTWHAIMSYAHQGIELKNIPGIAANPPRGSSPHAQIAAVSARGDIQRPAVLTRRGAEILQRLEHHMDEAARALAVAGTPAPLGPAGRQSALPALGTLAAADSEAAGPNGRN